MVRSIGALQVSAAFKNSDVLREDLHDFAADQIAAGSTPADVVAGDFTGITISYEDDTTFCRQWYLRNGSQALFVTYNCPRESRGLEDAVVLDALMTLRASGAKCGKT
jgi:hypothetical protein